VLRLKFYYTLKRITVTFAIILTLIGYRALGQIPVANFTASPLAGCSPLVVNFLDQSSGNPTGWSWDFGNGATSSIKNPATTYFNPGNYTITLTVKNAAGTNTLTRTQYITVYENPTANFTGSNIAGCFPVRTQFNDLSTPGSGNSNVIWFWDLGNGTQSSQQNPYVVYTSAGNYTITLKVTNDKGCTKVAVKPNYVQVIQGVKADYTNTLPSVCRSPASISFTNNSTGPGVLTYWWDFGDGNTSALQNPVNTYNASGTYTVTLVTSSSQGCIDTLVRTNKISIGGINTAFTPPPNICVGNASNFQNTSTPVPISSNWDFGDGTTSSLVSPTKLYAAPGIYSVKLINNYGNCQDSVSNNIQVFAKPVSNFTAPVTTRCQPQLRVDFQDLSTNAVSWQWNFGDGNTSTQQNPSHAYNSYGNFDVTLITTNSFGCTDTLTKPAFVKIAKPVITFVNIPKKGCVPFPISPVANIVTLDAVNSYLWDFGDGNTSTASNPSYTYNTQGTYTVKLQITTSTGCTESLVMPAAIKVGTHPIVNFSGSPSPVCAYQAVQFTDLSAPADEWLWQFGDGSSSIDQNPQHNYTDTGYIDVTLIATNNGCRDSTKKVNYIRVLPPISRFSYTPNCSNRFSFQFTDQSIGATSITWNFGDGAVSSIKDPLHVYSAYGTYYVTQTVTNGACTHSFTDTVIATDESPDFHADKTVLCKPETISFYTDNVTIPNIKDYFWEFGDGYSYHAYVYIAYRYYTTAGTYTVRLITTDINGCKDTAIKTNYIRVNGPTANFTAINTSGCKGLNTTFNDLSVTDGVNAIVNWKWDFGDGFVQNMSAPPFQHVYNSKGTYSVKLTVMDAFGCVDSVSKPNIVMTTDPNPDFYSKDTLTCPKGFVYFTNSSTGDSSSSYSYMWDFGDGGTSSALNPVHSYTATGFYTVKLTLADLFGCVDSIVRNQYIQVNKPIASFTVDDSASSCTPFEVHFTNTSQYYYLSSWDFVGGSSTLGAPIFYYTLPGIYNVQLAVVSPGGCTDTVRKKIQVFDTAGTKIDYLPLFGCKPLQVNLNATTTGIYSFLWDYGDGVVDTAGSVNMIHIYNTFGNFVPKLILTDPAGCLIPVTGRDTIIIKGANLKFGLDRTFLCDSGRVNFIDSTTFNDPITSYYWNFGDGSTSNVPSPSHVYAGPGLYTAYLVVQTQLGCIDTLRVKSPIKIVQSPSISVGGDSTACILEPMLHTGIFQRSDTSAVSWSWIFPNGNTSNLQNPPNQAYSTAGNFSVYALATNSSGCTDSVIKNILVYPLPTVTMPGTLTLQAGFPITIPATYSSNVISYLWSPPDYLSCTNCPQPVTAAHFNTTYGVSFVDSNGCRNTGAINIVVICKNANVFMPNTFSPNGDGNNDVFYPRGRGIERIKMLRVFNRWGQVVYERRDFPINDPLSGWDGKYKGQKPQPDVYVYQVEVFCDNGEIIRFNGNIALIL
jgi:gliding motility-associated-like protein